MKRHRDIFGKICSMENIETAHINARKGKRHYAEVQKVDAAPDRYFRRLRNMLIDGEYKTSAYQCMTKRCSGKVRGIAKLPYYPDRIVHHCISQVVDSIWRQSLIRDTYACIKGRGIHDGVRRIKNALYRDRPGTAYCLKMDVAQFYPSINHDVLKTIVRKKIKDPAALALMDEIIDSWSPGVPIGNYLSQHFGNLYLSGYDHWMKESLSRRHYFRYCDDVVILGQEKRDLHELRKRTEVFWRERLKLTIKPNWQVFPVDVRGIDFLGYRFFRGYTLLRKTTAKRFIRKMRRIKKQGAIVDPLHVISSVMSYDGWTRPANCLNLKRRHFDKEIRQVMSNASMRVGRKNPMRKVVA